MLKLILLLLTTLLASTAWTCRSQSPSDEDKNFLIEDPVKGSDYDHDYSHSGATETRGTDPVIICRIEVLTTKGFRKRYISKMENPILKELRKSTSFQCQKVLQHSQKGNCR